MLRFKTKPNKHKLILKIMTDISKNTELQQSCITAVMHSADMIIKTSNLGYDFFQENLLHLAL